MIEKRRHLFTLRDGRKLDVVEAGEKDWPAIIVHNGTPFAPGFIDEHVEDAHKRGLRIITYGRPGYGESTRQQGRTVGSVAQDTADLADALGIEQFATWGISGGGPHALACAALLGDRVVAAACLAGVAPYDSEGLDFLAGMGEDNIEEFSAAIEGEATISEFLKDIALALTNATTEEMVEQMQTLLSAADQAVFTGAFGEQLAKNMQGALDHGVYGWVDDDLAFTKDWGFSLSSIHVPLQIWQGEQDLMVPYNHGKWLAKEIPQAESYLTQEDGHLTLYVRRIPMVHEWLASKF